MSRLTGTDAYGLMEAYNNVYAPQELTEEQIWEEVETWVNALIEEGYDLSDYTWEEMFESYLSEAPVVPSMDQMVKKGFENQKFNQGFSKAATQLLGKPGQKPAARPVTTAPTTNTRTPSRLTPGVTTVPIRPRTPGVTPAPTNRPAAPAPTNRPVTTAPASPKPAAPAGGSALDRATASALTPTAFSPKPQSDVGAMIARSQARQAAQTPKPVASAPARPMGGARERMLQRQSFDVFDVIKGHLIDEGYADTEESALVIMANMSEEWREEILDERTRGEQGMSDSEVSRRRNLGGNTRFNVSSGALGDHGSQGAIQKFHKRKSGLRQAIHKSGRNTRGDTGESGGKGRYEANKDHTDGYPSITKRGQGPG